MISLHQNMFKDQNHLKVIVQVTQCQATARLS